MKRVSMIGILTVVLCMVGATVWADDGSLITSWGSGSSQNIKQLVPSFKAVGGDANSAGISVISSWDGSGADAFEITNLNELGAGPFSPQIMNDCDRSAVWSLIQPFHEKAMAAIKLPAQSTRDFMKGVKAGMVSKESAEAYVAQLDACASAYKTAFEQAVNDWIKKNQTEGASW